MRTHRTGPSPSTGEYQGRIPKGSPQSCHLKDEGARQASKFVVRISMSSLKAEEVESLRKGR